MIKNIPQGGNWKDIPISTINKSARLIKINQTGGRTTLYGRINYLKPCYTITTYFNRPGNGTYVHPIHNRVISVREAARIQSFPDYFYFYGNKKDTLNQVGNAVPPLLAFELMKSILNKIQISNSLDLFCGAGGLSAGLRMACVHSKIATDFDQSACITFKTNFPYSHVICGDITNATIKDEIVKQAKESKVDMICGGPPCQGFSLAGKRFIDDPRNTLFKHYINVAEQIKPKVILFENVEGLLSFEKGRIYSEIVNSFSELNYYAEGRLLIASNFGVPQKRKRVIILCIRKDLNIKPNNLFPAILEKTPTAFDAIGDLENIPCEENVKYNKVLFSDYVNKINRLFNTIK